MAIPEPLEFQRHRRRVPADATAACGAAEGFAGFCEALLARLDQVKAADLEVGFAQAKLLLLERYADYLTDTPPSHTNAAGRRKHRCLTEVLNETVKAIRQRHRQALPPRLALPPKLPPVPPPPPPRPRSAAEAALEALEQLY